MTSRENDLLCVICRRHSFSYQSMSITTVPKPLSAGLMMISCRRIRPFRARLSRLVKLSRTLVGLALRNCCSMVLQKVSKEASRPEWGVQVVFTRKVLWLSSEELVLSFSKKYSCSRSLLMKSEMSALNSGQSIWVGVGQNFRPRESKLTSS